MASTASNLIGPKWKFPFATSAANDGAPTTSATSARAHFFIATSEEETISELMLEERQQELHGPDPERDVLRRRIDNPRVVGIDVDRSEQLTRQRFVVHYAHHLGVEK